MDELFKFIDLEKKNILELHNIRHKAVHSINKLEFDIINNPVDITIRQHGMMYSIMNLAIIDEVIRNIEGKATINILEFTHFLN